MGTAGETDLGQVIKIEDVIFIKNNRFNMTKI